MPEKVRDYAATSQGHIEEPALRERLVRYAMNELAQKFTQARAVEELKSRAPGFTSSAVKLTGALNTMAADELLLAAMGTRGLLWEGDAADDQASKAVQATRAWLRNKSLTIAGGTKEVQLNIIAKRVLGLPD